jgi:hypothetical protein
LFAEACAGNVDKPISVEIGLDIVLVPVFQCMNAPTATASVQYMLGRSRKGTCVWSVRQRVHMGHNGIMVRWQHLVEYLGPEM